MNQNQTAVAAANALLESKTTRTFMVPITGNEEADANKDKSKAIRAVYLRARLALVALG